MIDGAFPPFGADPTDPTGIPGVATVFLQYGVLGAVALILLWFSYSSVKRERERADKAERERDEAQAMIRDKVVPAMISFTQATERVLDALAAAASGPRERR